MGSVCARAAGGERRTLPPAVRVGRRTEDDFVPDKDVPLLNNNRGNNNNNNRRRGRGNNNSGGGGAGGNRPQGGGQQLNRIDSRARGNAPQMLEKFRKLASDAHLNGDRVQAESYLQYADHYFRVIADTRVRQDEQRARPQGERWQESPEQDDDGLDFSNDSDFPAFDRPLVNRPEGRRDEARREEPRRDEAREPREQAREQPREPREQPREQQREPRRDRPEYDQSRREPLNRAAAAPAASAFEARQGDEGEPVDNDAGGNPFVPEARGNRGLRPRGGNRFRRDEEAREGQAPENQALENQAPESQANARPANDAGTSRYTRSAPREGGLDPSMLPPALGARPSDRNDSGNGADRAAPQQAVAAPADAAEAAPAPRRRGRPRKNPLPVVDGPVVDGPVADGSTEGLNG